MYRYKSLYFFLIGLTLIMGACGVPAISVPTPMPTQTPVPLYKAEPMLYSQAVSFCQDILSSGRNDYATDIPIQTLKPKSLLTVKIDPDAQTQEGDILFPYLEADACTRYRLCVVH